MLQQIKNLIVGFENMLSLSPELTFNFFLIIKYCILFAALMTVASINPIHSVLYLVLTFVLSASLIISLGAEFLGILLVIVYVGAIAVLFLFIVMMLNVEEQKRKISLNALYYLCSSLLVSILLTTTVTRFIYDFAAIKQTELLKVYTLPFLNQFVQWVEYIDVKNNIIAIGVVLYTYYFQLLFLAGFVLLLAMIASISLALMPPEFAMLKTKHQDKYAQLERSLNKSVHISTWNNNKI
jgi:NADH-quinone oxidoreductase subunit J